MDQIKRRDFSLTPPMTQAGSELKTPTGSGFTFIAGYKPRRGRGKIFGRGFDPATPVFGIFNPAGNGVKKTGSGF